MTSRLGILAATLLAGLLAGAPGLAPKAAAHPFGDPQTLTLTADGDRVTAHWRAGGVDDLVLLGISLGVIPEDRVLLDGAVIAQEGDLATLAAAPALADYLTDRLRLSRDGRACPPRLDDATALDDTGARLVARCAGSGPLEVTSTLLTDLHPAYRLMATGPNGQRVQYDVDNPTHSWALDGDGRAGRRGLSAFTQIVAVLSACAVLVGGGLVLRRRRQPVEATQ